MTEKEWQDKLTRNIRVVSSIVLARGLFLASI